MMVLLTERQEQHLRELSITTERSEQELAQEAIDRFLDYEQHFVLAVEEGLAAGERGELHSQSEAKARLEQLFLS